MSLTDQGLKLERPHPIADEMGSSGVQRIYRFGRFGLSLVNPPMLHYYPFAWEAAVIIFDSDAEDSDWQLTYETELSTDVEVFSNDQEANDFIIRAETVFGSLQDKADKILAATRKAKEESLSRMKTFLKEAKVRNGEPKQS